MEALIVLIVIAASIATVARWRRTSSESASNLVAEARRRHLVSGNYPSVCSWCKKTTLAHKMTILWLEDQRWDVLDMSSVAAAEPLEAAVARFALIFDQQPPSSRRICSEACLRAFLSGSGAAAERLRDRLGTCAYCETSYLLDRHHCPNCGASNAGARRS
jgi:hypothetical protein